MAIPRLNSQATKQLFEKCLWLTPLNMEPVITDNGSKFKGADDQQLADRASLDLSQYPKMNAVCERFHRTLQVEYVDFYEDWLFIDLNLFSEKNRRLTGQI